MKKKLLTALVLAICLGLCACAQRGGVAPASSAPSSRTEPAASAPAAPEQAAPSSAPPVQDLDSGTSQAPDGSTQEPDETARGEALPEGQPATPSAAGDPGSVETDLGSFSLWLPEEAVVKGNTIYADGSELAQKLAEVTVIDPIADPADPFAAYDQRYADAQSISEGSPGGYPGKSYFLQREVSAGGMTGFENTIVYCIQGDSQMVVLTFYPARGIGIHEQRQAFEEILDSIQI